MNNVATVALIQEYRIVVRPRLFGFDGYTAAMLRSVSADGTIIKVWRQTFAEGSTMERAVAECAAKCAAFVETNEYKQAISW